MRLQRVILFYLPLTGADLEEERAAILRKTVELQENVLGRVLVISHYNSNIEKLIRITSLVRAALLATIVILSPKDQSFLPSVEEHADFYDSIVVLIEEVNPQELETVCKTYGDISDDQFYSVNLGDMVVFSFSS